MENEIWVPVLGNDAYQASNQGNIMSLNYRRTGKEKILKPKKDKYGYLRVCLCKDGKVKWYGVHRLVWEAFNGPIPEGMQINHLSERKDQNNLENLSLATPKENTNWGTGIKRRAEKLMNRPDHSKWVIKLSKNNEILHFYQSIHEASRECGLFVQSIHACCKGKTKTAGGYKWKYAE